MPEPTTKGRSSPLGASVSADGANFSIYSKHATRLDLLFFDGADDACPSRVIPIDPATNRTYHYWHVFVPGVKAGQIYGYRASGTFDPASGMRFDDHKLLLDPYGVAVVVPQNYSREAARNERRQRRDGDEKRGGGSVGLRLGRRHAAPSTVLPDDHLRDACARFYASSQLRCRRRQARHVRRSDRENSISAGTRRDGRRTDARVSSSIPRMLRPGWSITGVTRRSRSLRRTRPTARDGTRSARWTSSATWSKHCIAPGIEVILDVVFNHTAEGDHERANAELPRF